ncbi:MAG: hypothetical protein R2801_10230 [Chitinophagales bacterium]
MEYDYFPPTQLNLPLWKRKLIKNLFFVGQQRNRLRLQVKV